MIRLAVREMGQRRLRSALTALAVVLGVAMIAGTYVQTDRIRSAFHEITRTSNQGTDVVVQARQAFDGPTMGAPGTIPADALRRTRAVPGVATAAARLTESGSLVVDGAAISSGFAPSIVMTAVPTPFDPMRLVRGRSPRRAGEVVVNRGLAEEHDVHVGDRARLTTRTGTRPVVISGIADYGRAASLGGATLVVTRLEDAQRWFDRRGRISQVLVAAQEGVDDTVLAERVARAVPSTLDVRTGAADAERTSESAGDAIGSFLTPVLLTLAGAALLVGAFIIFNTYSITVAQRTREFALLRALGASRRGVLTAVLAEAALLGTVASVLGLGLGLGVAALLGRLFDAAGFGIPAGSLELAPRTIVLSLAVGIGVTLAAAVGPAVRATRVPPLVALRGDAPTGPDHHRRRLAISTVVVAAGAALLVTGLFAGGPATSRLGALAGGAILVFVGVALVARHVVRPLAGAIGLPLVRLFREPGRLARENAMRSPERTATSAAALMVGLGMVVFVAVFAAAFKDSVTGSLDERLRADVVITGDGQRPVPASVGDTVRRIPGVRAATPLLLQPVGVDGASPKAVTDYLNGVDTSLLNVYAFDWIDGSDDLLARLGGDGALVEEQFAEAHGLERGERFRAKVSTGGEATFIVRGIYRDPAVLAGAMVTAERFVRLTDSSDPFGWFLVAAPGTGTATTHRVEDALNAPYPGVKVQTRAEYQQDVTDQVDTLVNLLYALLGMSLVISLFGIVNSLFLGVFERTREFGLLRAVGATQRQVRHVVRWESVITALIGALLGTVVGIAFGALAVAALADLGLRLSIPVGQLVVFLVLAVLVGVAGAVVPARRAARVDVLTAVREE